jgi:chromosome partitioning protein
MKIVAVYNMKGGVGKTTTAVNLSYLAAKTGLRVLLWDLDPQAASSFAFRVQPHGEGFNKKWMESGQVLAAAIKETDYSNLDMLPADFTYRKIDRLLGNLGKPERVVASLLDTFRLDYDLVVLDCPAGFSLLIEGIFGAADVMLVPSIPTVLSLRTLAKLVEWAIHSDSTSELAAFFSMVDRRKVLHRRVYEWSAGHPEIFLRGHIPSASIVEKMAVRRTPLAVFAPREDATAAFAGIWDELQSRLQKRAEGNDRPLDLRLLLRSIESLLVRLESGDREEPAPSGQPLGFDHNDASAPEPHDDIHFVHSFDTDDRAQAAGHAPVHDDAPSQPCVTEPEESSADETMAVVSRSR